MVPFFEAHGYKCPTDQTKGVIQFARGTDLPVYDYWATVPGAKENFSAFMTEVRAARPSWLDWFPVQDEIVAGAVGEGDAPFIVDIGGGRGHDLKAFRERFPNLSNRLILQDLHNVLKDNNDLDGVQQMEYDFFTPQPVCGKIQTPDLISVGFAQTSNLGADALQGQECTFNTSFFIIGRTRMRFRY